MYIPIPAMSQKIAVSYDVFLFYFSDYGGKGSIKVFSAIGHFLYEIKLPNSPYISDFIFWKNNLFVISSGKDIHNYEIHYKEEKNN